MPGSARLPDCTRIQRMSFVIMNQKLLSVFANQSDSSRLAEK